MATDDIFFERSISDTELESLFKSVNKKLIDAMIANVAVLKDKNASPLERKRAELNVKMIKDHTGQTRLDPNVVRAPVVGSTPAAPKNAGKTIKNKPLEYNEDFAHFNVSEQSYKSMHPSHKQVMHDFYREVLAGKHPDEYAKIKSAREEKVKAQQGLNPYKEVSVTKPAATQPPVVATPPVKAPTPSMNPANPHIQQPTEDKIKKSADRLGGLLKSIKEHLK